MFLPIHHTFGPHVNGAYVWKALSLLLQPWKWQSGNKASQLQQALSRAYNGNCITFSTGREALFTALKSLGVKKGDEVIMQAYTCSVVPNAIKATGATVVYCDIHKETLNIDCAKLSKKITKNTKAIICQHTFGIPADTKTLRSICNQHNIRLIEDCAHCLPDKYGPEDIGKRGDFLLLSFGRDKAISGISGGAIISRKSEITRKIESLQEKATPVPRSTIVRLLLYPLIYAVCRPMYGIKLGKAVLALAAKCKLLLPIVTQVEKEGRTSNTIHIIPNACAALALHSFAELHAINKKRRKVTNYYLNSISIKAVHIPNILDADWPLQKFPIFVKQASRIRQKLKLHNIYLDDGWCSNVINPAGVNQESMGYTDGSCPVAETVIDKILCLPTHSTHSHKQSKTVVQMLENTVPKY